MNGYLWLCSGGQSQWTKRFFAVREDFVLYSFKGAKDTSAKTSLPLPGCNISFPDSKDELVMKDVRKSSSQEPPLIFKVTHYSRVYYLKADSKDEMAKYANLSHHLHIPYSYNSYMYILVFRWMAVLELASKAELPSQSPQMSQSSSS